MNQISLPISLDFYLARGVWRLCTALFALLITVIAVHAQGTESAETSAPIIDDRAPVIVEGVSQGDVFGFGRSVKITGTVTHGAMAFGGDVIVEGRVEGDVAAIGGSVVQREGSFIGGDVIVIGGAYHHGKNAPGRNPSSTTMMVAGYEQELRNIARNPASLLTPRLSLAYLGQRLLAVLFWFIVSLALTAVTPGAVSRAVARLQLTNLRVAVIGFFASVVIAFGVPVCLRYLPTVVSALAVVTAVLLLVLAYLFGRVAIHAATGRWLQRKFFSEKKHSESVALLLGAGFWAVILSLPFVWPLVVAGLLVTSLGLALTARYRVGWKRA